MSESETDVEGGEEANFQQGNHHEQEVRLNRAILMRGISSVSCDKRESVEVDKQFHRVTHLHLQAKGIDVMESLHHFRALSVLYLYDNRIREIIGLENLRNLEALYMQKNKLEKISGLLGCRKLRKLYLGQNEIVVVEGLHLLTQLEEFHIEHQKLQAGEQLIFDPSTLDTLSTCLQVLNIGGNRITSLEDLAGMRELHTLQAQANQISDLEKTSLILTTIPNLKVVDLRKNPIAKSSKYQEKMIGHCQTLELLDGKTYSANSRRFIGKFCEMKANNLRRSLATMEIGVVNSDTSTGERGLMPNSEFIPSVRVDTQESETAEFPREEDIDQRLARISLIGRYSNHGLQSQAMDMAHSRRNLTLVKPQEICLPQFILASKVQRQNSTESLPGPKPKVFRGLANRGYSAVTKIPVGRSLAMSRSRCSSSSIDRMMPVARSFHTLQGPGGQGDSNVTQSQPPPSLSWTKAPEPKVMKLPPWPHILRHLGTTEKVNFI